jgi:hypothetical protein
MNLAGILSKLAAKHAPVGPSIRQAAEQAADVGLGPDVVPPRPKPEPPSKPGLPEERPDVVEGELVEDLPPPKEKPPEPEPAPKEFEPVTHEEAAEFVRAAEGPRTIGEQGMNTNYTRWNTKEEMIEMWETAGRQREQAGTKAKRMSWEAMIQLAKDKGSGKDPVGFLIKAVEDGTVDINTLPGDMMVARDAAVQISEDIFRQSKQIAYNEKHGLPTSKEDLFAYEVNLTKFRAIQEGVEKVTDIAGKLLGSMRYVASNKGRVRVSQLGDFVDDLGGEATIKQKAQNIAEMMEMGGDASDLSKRVRQGFLVKSAEALEAFRYNNMLSGLATALRNTIGNTFHNAYRFTTEGIGAAIGSGRHVMRRARGLGANPDAVLMRDFTKGIQAMTQSFLESMDLSMKTWVDPSFEIGQAGKLEARQKFSLRSSRPAQMVEKQFGFFGRGLVEMVDTMMFTLGPRNLLSGDIFFKNALWRFETHEFAAKQVRLEGLTGDAAKARFDQILTAKKMPVNMFEQSMQAAAVGTHTQQPAMGTFARRFLDLRNSKGALGFTMRWAIPFARVLVNIMTWSAKQASLPLHMAAPTQAGKRLRSDVFQGTKEGNDYLGRLAVYGTLFSIVGQQTTQNNITGTGRYVDVRTLRQWKEDGWQPMSIRRTQPDGTYKYYSFAQIQPVGTLIGWMADVTDVINYYSRPDADADAMLDIITGMFKTLVAGPFEAPFAKGLYDWMGIMFSEKEPKKVIKGVARQYTGPNWLRDIENVYDADRSDTYGDSMFDEIANDFEAKIPGYASDMPPRLTIFGENAKPAESPWSIIPVTTSKNDDIFMALAESDVFVEPPKDHIIRIDGQNVDLSRMKDEKGWEWKFHQYKKILGQERKKSLQKMIRSSRYLKAIPGPSGTDSSRKEVTGSLLNEALTDARNAAHEKFAKVNPGSEFARALEGKRIKQEVERQRPLHAGQREREQEKAARREAKF